MKARILGALCAGLFSLGLVSTANAALFPVTSGPLAGLAVYDSVLDITWTQDADINGLGNWANQTTWAAGLGLGGFSDWRLPNMDVNGDSTVINCSGGGVTGCADNEMGFLYYEEGITCTAPGPFSNIGCLTSPSTNNYWSSTELIANNRWNFRFLVGDQFGLNEASQISAWAVHDGNIGMVPVPAAVWLFGSALGLLGWLRRRNGAAKIGAIAR